MHPTPFEMNQEITGQRHEEHDKLILLFNVTRNISRELLLDRLLMLIMDEVKKVLHCDRCTVFVLDRDKNELWSQVAHGEKEIRFPSHMGIAGHVATTGEILNIPDAYADPRFNPNIDKKTGYRTRCMLTVPMRNKLGEIIGVFQALNKEGGVFTQEDEELLNTISVIAATQIENAQLYDEQKKTFDSMIETLASTIDARDPMTAGHSKRIALYADEVAKTIRLGASERQTLRIAALLHDLGKIAVREAILTKEGQLTEEEYLHIQRHPIYTKTILEKINFSRELRQVPVIAASHHEKLDGSGYPAGLTNDSIPHLGKILAVVDVFDALTSKRHYRDRMDFQNVIYYFENSTGTYFDKMFIDALKQMPLDRFIVILENEKKDSIHEKDLTFLAAYSIQDLLNAIHSNCRDAEAQKLADVFSYYYSRDFIREEAHASDRSDR